MTIVTNDLKSENLNNFEEVKEDIREKPSTQNDCKGQLSFGTKHDILCCVII